MNKMKTLAASSISGKIGSRSLSLKEIIQITRGIENLRFRMENFSHIGDFQRFISKEMNQTLVLTKDEGWKREEIPAGYEPYPCGNEGPYKIVEHKGILCYEVHYAYDYLKGPAYDPVTEVLPLERYSVKINTTSLEHKFPGATRELEEIYRDIFTK